MVSFWRAGGQSWRQPARVRPVHPFPCPSAGAFKIPSSNTPSSNALCCRQPPCPLRGGRGVAGRWLSAGRWGDSVPRCILAAKATEWSLVYQCLRPSDVASFCEVLLFFCSGFLALIAFKMHLRCLSDPHTQSQPLQPLPWHFPKPLDYLGPLIFPPAPMFYALVMPPFLLISFSQYLACPCCPLLFNLLLTSHHNPWASL